MSAIDAIQGGLKNFNDIMEGFGTRITGARKIKLFNEDGTVAAGAVPPTNHGSAFGYGFAADSKTLGASNY